MKPNNITRFLESRKIHYTAFELPSEKLGAVEVARLLGVPPEEVFKTIVITRIGRGKPLLVLVPGIKEVNLRSLANSLDEKKLCKPTEREAERLTNLQAGGISPLALLNRGFQVILDISAMKYDEIYISGGQRGLDIRLSVQDLVSLTNATFVDVCHNPSGSNL